MNSQPGITSPENFPIRDVMNRPQKNGRVINPVGFGEMGGSSGPSCWPKGNEMKVDAPTSIKAGKAAGEKKASRR